MRCTECYYAEMEHDKHGLVTGITCRNGAFKFIPWDTASVVYCGDFAERDD